MRKILSLVATAVFLCPLFSFSAHAYSPIPVPDIDHTNLHKMAEGCYPGNFREAWSAIPPSERQAEINRLDREGYTPLSYAAEKGCMEIVKILVTSGASVDATDEYSRWTPLLRASENQKAEVVAYLLKHHADVDHKAGYLGQTPLTEAILGPFFGEDPEKNRGETARLLISAGADVNLPGRGGWTPLMAAVFRGDTELVKSLISKGANISAVDEKGKTALDYANERGERDIVKLFTPDTTLVKGS